MQFTSSAFGIFLPIVFLLYWFVFGRRLWMQNLFLIIVGYFFYGLWDIRFPALMTVNTLLDYFIGISLGKTNNPHIRKALIVLSISVNLGLLVVYKYLDFFLSAATKIESLIGISAHSYHIRLFLPIAVSYYTLQTMGYSIDVFRGKTKPTNNILAFVAYISFFPKLLAGPIERSSSFMQQFFCARRFDAVASKNALRQFLWGLFKKVVIADNCAGIVNAIFADPSSHSGMTLVYGAILYAFQIYADFSGYSDMALGVGRLFGFNLSTNFLYPYFSKSMPEFWRRWHISLSSWLRDYVFLPLSYSLARRLPQKRRFGLRFDQIINCIAIMTTFVLCGLWHGANVTFLLWGFVHGIYLLPQLFVKKGKIRRRLEKDMVIGSLVGILRISRSFILVTASWILFRSESLEKGINYFAGIFSPSLLSIPEMLSLPLCGSIVIMVVLEWLQRSKEHALQFDSEYIPKALRWCLYYGLLALILWRGGYNAPFIYMQF